MEKSTCSKGETGAAERPESCRPLLWAVFLGWTGWLLWMLLFRRLGSAQRGSLGEYAAAHTQLRPFFTVSQQLVLGLGGSRHAWRNLGGNTLLFLPVGWLLPGLFRAMRRFWRFLPAFAGGVALVEGAQLVLQVGICDVDDLLLNCMGAALGWLLWKKYRNRA